MAAESPKRCVKGELCGSSHGIRTLCKYNNLQYLFRDLVKDEWDFEKNEHKPFQYFPRSELKVFWVCKNNICGCHKWKATIHGRTAKKSSGCPYCNKGKVCIHNNLLAKYKKLVYEWDYGKNEDDPSLVSPGSHKPAFWICISCNHRWQAPIRNRIYKNGFSPCPLCKNIIN
jgi:hypothetical protein